MLVICKEANTCRQVAPHRHGFALQSFGEVVKVQGHKYVRHQLERSNGSPPRPLIAHVSSLNCLSDHAVAGYLGVYPKFTLSNVTADLKSTPANAAAVHEIDRENEPLHLALKSQGTFIF